MIFCKQDRGKPKCLSCPEDEISAPVHTLSGNFVTISNTKFPNTLTKFLIFTLYNNFIYTVA